MPRPNNLSTNIFLDSGDPEETRQTIEMLGFLDGQTTNPSLIAKNPEAQKRIASGSKFSTEEVSEFYKKQVTDVAGLIPGGSVSVEVYADNTTTENNMLAQAREMYTWIPNAHIKFPTTVAGLEAAERAIAEGMRVNMTLVFSQEQAAAVYAATRGASKGDVFVSPFAGRLDDVGMNGMDLIKNINTMYKESDGHVEVLAASIRNSDHLMTAFAMKTDIVTVPFKILKEWVDGGMRVPDDSYVYDVAALNPIEYEPIKLHTDWRSYNISHEMTDAGLEKFVQDWHTLVAQ